MKIIISPAKKMKAETYLEGKINPILKDKSYTLVKFLKSLTIDEISSSFKIKGKLLNETIDLIDHLDLDHDLHPAIFSYDGIQYKYMGANIFSNDELDYVNNHLFILSGLYGVLRPLDSITRYRLEMQAQFKGKEIEDLYKYWNKDIYNVVYQDDDTVLNLASLEYSKTIKPYINDSQKFVDVFFYELENNKLVEKGVYAKMMRGTMVKWLAQNKIDTIEEVKNFEEDGYKYSLEHSTNNKLVFIRQER